jgi:hypothetical protein
LWREKGSVDKVLDVVVNESPGADRKTPRDNTDQLVADARPAVTSTPLVGLTTSHTGHTPEAEARRVSTDLNSELVRRARQQFRDRQKARGYSIEQAPADQQPERSAIVISNDYVPPSGRETTPESPIRFSERSVPDASFHQVPEIGSDDELPFRARPESPPPRRTDDYEHVPIRSLGGPEPEPAHAEYCSELDDEYPFAEQTSSWDDRSDPEPERYDPDSHAAEWWPNRDPLIVSDEHDQASFAVDEAFDEWSDPLRDDPQHPPHSLWADIPVCCRTCRDFRPAGEGGRGWCTNKWAFKHRRMVDADDCPCETSIGNWWLPADSAWQGELDATELGQPTPLMDKYFGRPGASPEEHFVERRRRRS